MAKLYPSDIWRRGDALDPLEKLVALALLDYGDRIYPSQSHVAAKTGLSLATVKRVMRSLRAKLVISVKRNRKGLAYAFVMAQPDTFESVTQTPVKAQPDTDPVSQRATNYPKNYPTNQGAPDGAAGGWEVPSDVEGRIRIRDPRADLASQRKVCRRVMVQHGLTEDEARRSWRDLCLGWARTGRSAYDILNEQVQQLSGARDVRAVLLHRLKGVAA
jgi:hypothetical protein